MTFVLIGPRRSGNFLLRKERKRSRPSGSVPPAPKASTRARTSSEVTQPGTSSSSSSRPSGGQDKKGGGVSGCTWCCVLEASSPPARPRSSERGGSVFGCSSAACELASISSAPSGAVEGEVACSQRMPPACPASSVASPRSSQHALRRGESGESSVVRSRSRSSRVSRSSDRGTRKDRRPVLGRTALAIAPVVLALALLTARCQAVESVGDGSRLDHCPPANGCDVIGLGLWTNPDHVAFALGLGEIGRDPQIATALNVTGRILQTTIGLTATGRVLQTATDHVDSICNPLLVGRLL